MRKLFRQIFRFGIAGGLAFVIDYATLIICTEIFRINYLISSAIAFCTSVVFNYVLSIIWVFDVKNNGLSKKSQFWIFLVLSVSGLGMTELLMWLGTDKLRFHYLITKLVATVIVMIYNFITRKIFLEGDNRGYERTSR